ncbi:hypothetical protein Tco_1102989 [Tanacetum coccineum]
MPRVVKSRDEIFSRWGYCDNHDLSRLDNQSIERDRLIGIGFVLNFVKFISFTFGDKEMISVIEAVGLRRWSLGSLIVEITNARGGKSRVYVIELVFIFSPFGNFDVFPLVLKVTRLLGLVSKTVEVEVRGIIRWVFLENRYDVLYRSIPIVHAKFEISLWRVLEVDVRTYRLVVRVDSIAKRNGIIRDPRAIRFANSYRIDDFRKARRSGKIAEMCMVRVGFECKDLEACLEKGEGDCLYIATTEGSYEALIFEAKYPTGKGKCRLYRGSKEKMDEAKNEYRDRSDSKWKFEYKGHQDVSTTELPGRK